MSDPDPFGLVGVLLDGQYRVDALIGEGGFGVVYKGWHLTFEQPIAIKALKVPRASESAVQLGVLAKFREEAKLLYVLSQTSLHIVRSIGFGATNTPAGIWAPFIVLEWLEGQSLEAELEARRARGMKGRSISDAIGLLEPAAQGLSAAHKKRVAHRDVKPANFFLTAANEGEPIALKVLDFGIAKVMAEGADASGPSGTSSGFSSFSWLYAAPEQFDPRHGPTGPWTDVYSFAMILTEVLTDRPPHDGTDAISILKESSDAARRPTPNARGANVPDPIEAVCARALSVDPKARYADMDELWRALTDAVAASGGLRARSGTAAIASVQQPARVATQPLPAVASTTPAIAPLYTPAPFTPVKPTPRSGSAPPPPQQVAAYAPAPRPPSPSWADAPRPLAPSWADARATAPAVYAPPMPYGQPQSYSPTPRARSSGCTTALIVLGIVALVLAGALLLTCGGALAQSCAS